MWEDYKTHIAHVFMVTTTANMVKFWVNHDFMKLLSKHGTSKMINRIKILNTFRNEKWECYGLSVYIRVALKKQRTISFNATTPVSYC